MIDVKLFTQGDMVDIDMEANDSTTNKIQVKT